MIDQVGGRRPGRPTDTVPAMDDEQRRSGPGPFASMLGFRVVRADEDGALIEADPQPEHLNGGGIVHGGYLTALLDSATGWAVHARLPTGVAAPHVQLSVQYVRSAAAGQPLVCRGRCIAAGRRIASAEAEITQGDRLIARAVTTHAVLRGD
jgi:acyl-CoA thioesterase